MLLVKRIDKEMRNKFTVIRQRGDKRYEGGMAMWFNTRLSFKFEVVIDKEK